MAEQANSAEGAVVPTRASLMRIEPVNRNASPPRIVAGGAQILQFPSGVAAISRDDEMIEIVAGLKAGEVLPAAYGMMSELFSDRDMPDSDRLDRLNLVRLCTSRLLIEEGRL